MKTHRILVPIVAIGLLAGVVTLAAAETKKHRAVFDVNSGDPQVWGATLNNVDNLKTALGNVSIEVVAHGNGLEMLVSAKLGAQRAARAEKLAREGVVFAACQNTMKRKGLTVKELFPWATTVDSGVAELVRKQEAHWSYLHPGT